jgi:hypothetical protein
LLANQGVLEASSILGVNRLVKLPSTSWQIGLHKQGVRTNSEQQLLPDYLQASSYANRATEIPPIQPLEGGFPEVSISHL